MNARNAKMSSPEKEQKKLDGGDYDNRRLTRYYNDQGETEEWATGKGSSSRSV